MKVLETEEVFESENPENSRLVMLTLYPWPWPHNDEDVNDLALHLVSKSWREEKNVFQMLGPALLFRKAPKPSRSILKSPLGGAPRQGLDLNSFWAAVRHILAPHGLQRPVPKAAPVTKFKAKAIPPGPASLGSIPQSQNLGAAVPKAVPKPKLLASAAKAPAAKHIPKMPPAPKGNNFLLLVDSDSDSDSKSPHVPPKKPEARPPVTCTPHLGAQAASVMAVSDTPTPAKCAPLETIRPAPSPSSPDELRSVLTAEMLVSSARATSDSSAPGRLQCLAPSPNVVRRCPALVPQWNAGDMLTQSPIHLLRKLLQESTKFLHHIVLARFKSNDSSKKNPSFVFKVSDRHHNIMEQTGEIRGIYGISGFRMIDGRSQEFVHSAEAFENSRLHEVKDLGRLLDHVLKRNKFYGASQADARVLAIIRNSFSHRPYLRHASRDPNLVHEEVLQASSRFLSILLNLVDMEQLEKKQNVETSTVKFFRNILASFKHSISRMRKMQASSLRGESIDVRSLNTNFLQSRRQQQHR